MALISKPFTFSAGATIVASEHNSNFDTLINLVNGNIDNANIGASAAIVDTKLAAINTAGKVAGSALTTLTGIPGGAGLIPLANRSRLTTQGDIVFHDGTSDARLAAGTSGFILETKGAASDPVYRARIKTFYAEDPSFTLTGSLTDVVTISTIVEVTSDVYIFINFHINDDRPGGSGSTFYNIERNSTVLVAETDVDPTDSKPRSVTAFDQDGGRAAGTFTYKLRMRGTGSVGTIGRSSILTLVVPQ